MKKVVIAGAVLAIGLLVYAFTIPKAAVSAAAVDGDEIKWYSWDEAVALSAKKPRKMFIDVYTDWCGWCKKMDASTFKDKDVVAYINKNFYPVKFDAEQKEDIKYKEHTLKYQPSAGRRGVHELAVALLDGRLSYPSYVYLDENQDRITISPGYKEAPAILKELQFIAGEYYKKTTYEQFLQSGGK